MKNILDLEQKLIGFSQITEDLEEAKNMDDVAVITSYYRHKFESLWNTFDLMCKDYHNMRQPDTSLDEWKEFLGVNTDEDEEPGAIPVVLSDDTHRDSILSELHAPDSPPADVLPPCDVEPRQDYP